MQNDVGSEYINPRVYVNIKYQYMISNLLIQCENHLKDCKFSFKCVHLSIQHN